MIHTIKSLYNNGQGSSIKAISQHLKVSRNTVRKYLRMDEESIAQQQSNPSRYKHLDDCRDYIIHLLESFPKLSAVKVLRKVRECYPSLNVSDRSARRYVRDLKETTTLKQKRYYQPVLDMVPGVQCQVDPGELRGVLIDGVETTLYFVVFVLSFSRLMYVALSRTPVDTERFIQMHDEAFRYFGGCPRECVYDQTKLVVLQEHYRELEVNPRFHQYATTVGFQVKACRGYDPESKGKVEAGVKYVKHNGLYGETFKSWPALEGYLSNWLKETANARIHATTNKPPQAYYDAQERSFMQPYATPEGFQDQGLMTRKADKTGLISWKANKYSVPMAYQNSRVEIKPEGGLLLIYDRQTQEEIARHHLHSGKGHIVKNNNHYRDPSQAIADHEQAIEQHVGESLGKRLCQCLQKAVPDNYKDQLVGLQSVLKKYEPLNLSLLESISHRPSVSARQVDELLEAYSQAPERYQEETTFTPASPELLTQLSAYQSVLSTINRTGAYHE